MLASYEKSLGRILKILEFFLRKGVWKMKLGRTLPVVKVIALPDGVLG